MKKSLQRAFQFIGLDVRRNRRFDSFDRSRQRLLLGCSVVLDAGANEGQWAKSIRNSGWTGPIVSFEPISSIAEKLQSEARDDEGWSIHAIGLGSATKQQSINVSDNLGSSSSFFQIEDRVLKVEPSAQFIRSEEVEIRRLDELSCVNGGDLVFLKADVQGFELEVLSGAAGFIEQVVAIELECSLVPLYVGQPNMAQVMATCEALGFAPIQIRPGFADLHNGDLLQVDVLFERIRGDQF
jgi:FkbM family methyltransferase